MAAGWPERRNGGGLSSCPSCLRALPDSTGAVAQLLPLVTVRNRGLNLEDTDVALWDKLKDEVDKAGRVAQKAVDEGKARLDLMRAKQRADRAAQALGYAVYEARKTGGDLAADQYHRLSGDLAAAMAEVRGLEAQLKSDAPGMEAGAGPT